MRIFKECKDLKEVRFEIDSIDQEVIKLLGKRFAYVKQASAFKTSEETVKAPDRFYNMLQKRRELAIKNRLDPDIIEKMFKDLVNHFIREELKEWKK